MAASQELPSKDALEPEPEDGNADTEQSYSVSWEENDPRNPMNWPDSRKWGIIGALSLMTFLMFASHCNSPSSY